ncbi:MAG: hypothetical protein IT518_02435, partial [Burkholderiales bacterium]|nr:hypothetical protein [Burkholderiales bacterium]
MVTPHDPAQFFADLMKSGQEQMQKMMGGAGSPDATGMSAQMAAVIKQGADLQQQYLSMMQGMASAWLGAATPGAPAIDDKRFASD